MTVRLQIEPDEAIVCALCRNDFTALLDGELDDTRRRELERHLATASANCTCLHDLHALKRTGDLFREESHLTAPPQFAHLVTRQLQRKHRRNRLFRKWLPLALLMAFAVAAVFGVWYRLDMAQ